MATATRETLYAAMQAAARDQQRPGETPEQAFTRFLSTPTGQELYQRYGAADPAPPSPPSPPLPDVERACQNSVLRAIDRGAARLRQAQPDLTPEQAVAQAVAADPQL